MNPKPTSPIPEKEIVNPINPLLPTDKKVDKLVELSLENESLVNKFIERLDKKYGTRSKCNHKDRDRIKEKAERPSIRKTKAWFDVEHIRDGFRFKSVLDDITVLPKIAEELKAIGFGMVKIDVDKVLEPGDWGWRITVIDLRMPNRQLVEYYMPVRELEEAKNAGNHELFEKWRSRKLESLTESERVEFYKDVEVSDQRYEQAWQAYLKRTGQTEEAVRKSLEEMRKILES